MVTNGIKDFIKELEILKGLQVCINIGHKLYGDQNVKCVFQMVNDEKRLGFSIHEQHIYIEKDNIKHIGIKGNLYYFADEVMCIKIRKL